MADVEKQLTDGTRMYLIPPSLPWTAKEVTTAEIDLSFYDYSQNPPEAIYAGETKEAIQDGYFAESTLRSAPYFLLHIDGITEDLTEE